MKRFSSGWLAAPATAYLAILFIGPALTVLAYSFCETDKNGVVNDSADVTVQIHVSSPPIGKNDHFDVLEQSASTQTKTSVLLDNGNGPDTDPTEFRPLSAELVNNVNLTGAGTVTFRPDGTFDYIPDAAANFNTDREPKPDIFFTYRVVAGAGTANEAKSAVTTVFLTVKEVNDNPSASPVGPTIVIKQNAAGTIGLNQNINIPASAISIAPDVQETLKITAVTGTSGTVTADASGNTATKATTALGGKVYLQNFQIKYDAPQATGADSFTYTVSDFDQTTGAARGGSASALVTLDVKDFIPKQISGTVFSDTGVFINGQLVGKDDGIQQAGEQPLAGVTIHLDGRDVTSSTTENVHLIAVTDVNGKYVFPDPAHDANITADYVLKPPAPGTSYRLSEEQPAFILEGVDNGPTNVLDTNTDASQGHVGAIVTNSALKDSFFSLAWSLTDQSNFNAALGLSILSGLNFGEAGIDLRTTAQGGSLTDVSGMKQEYVYPGQNGYVFALQTGTTDTILWSKKLDPSGTAWNGYTDITVDLHSAFDTNLNQLVPELTFTARDAQGTLRTATLRLDKYIPNSTACFRILAVGTDGRYIIRVDGSAFGSTVQQPYDGMFGPQLTAATQQAHGEGEAPVNQQYAGAADAVFTEKSWA